MITGLKRGGRITTTTPLNSKIIIQGIDTQELLPRGTPEEVKEGVKNTIKTYAPGGGYILGPSHNIGPDNPPENIVAMYEAAQEYGKYPIS